MDSSEPVSRPRRWALPWQCLLAIGLVLGALLLRETLRPWLGEQLPLLALLAALLVLVPAVRPLPLLLGAAVAGLGLLWLPPASPGAWAWFVGAVLLAGAATGYGARLLARQRRLAVEFASRCEQLSAAVEQVADGVVRTDAAGRIIDLNAAACRLAGWTRQQAQGQPLAQVVRIVGEADGSSGGDGQRLLARDGRETPVEQRTLPVPTGGRATRHGVLVIRDLSERRRAATEREQDARRKHDFLAVLAHELRNPLGPAVSALQVIDAPSADAAARARALAVLQRQLRQMVRLIDDLMDVGRMTHDRLVLQRAPVSLQRVVRRSVEACRWQLDSASQTLELQLADAPIGAQADAVRLEQILCQLLDNAGKFSPPGSRIHLSLQRADAEAELHVRDRGIGIAADRLPRLFEMFAPGRPGTAAAGSLGIGLALARRLAELHGGSLQAHSDGPGLGSDFVLRLPVDAELSTTLAAAAADAPRDAAGGAGRGCRVLVVDDNQDAADSLSELLRINGHRTHTAYDGRDVLALAQAFQPHALLLDIGLPGLSGLDVARLLRAQPWGAKLLLLAMTGWGQEADRQASAAAGFDEHMVKPVDTLRLLRLLAERLRQVDAV